MIIQYYLFFCFITIWLIDLANCKNKLPRNCYDHKCFCSQKSITCKRRKLLQIPFLFPLTAVEDVQEIDLSYNMQTTLPANSFHNLVNLKKVVLKENSFEEVHEASFNVTTQPFRKHVSPIEFIDFRSQLAGFKLLILFTIPQLF